MHAIMNCEKKFHVVSFFVFTKYYPSENINLYSRRTQGTDTAMGSILGGSNLV